MNWHDYYVMPVIYRKWLLDRVVQEINRSAQDGEKAVPKGLNPEPSIAAAMGKRPFAPHGLKRF